MSCCTLARAAHAKWGDSIQEYQCVDISQDINTLAEYLLRGKTDKYISVVIKGPCEVIHISSVNPLTPNSAKPKNR